MDSYGIELIHPIRQGRSPAQIGCKALSNHRRIADVKLCLLSEVAAWLAAPANAYNT